MYVWLFRLNVWKLSANFIFQSHQPAATAASQGGGLLYYFKCFYIYFLNNDNINYYYYIIILFYSFLVICNVFACGCQNEEGILAEKIKKLN